LGITRKWSVQFKHMAAWTAAPQDLLNAKGAAHSPTE